jgi:uncharacterized protein (TIGR02996 family)
LNTREALLQAIIADPDDDAPRLVYADHLDETGDPAEAARAELIRFQIATARLPDGHPDKSGRMEQAVRMTDEFKSTWFSWVRDEGCLPYPQRGFLDHWSCGSKEDQLADLQDAFDQEPITNATFFLNGSDLPELATWPQLARLRQLNLWPDEPTGDDILAFLSSPHLTGLREFEYMGRRGTRTPFVNAARLLATSPQYAGLRSLCIISAGVGDLGATALARSTVLTGLTGLALSHCDVGPSGCGELLSSPVVAGLTNLGLGGNVRTATDGETLAAFLADSPHLARLEVLVLDETAITDRAAAHLARADWPALKALVLLPHELNDSTPTGLPTMTAAGLESLTAARWFCGVEGLELSGHLLGDTGAHALAAARLPRLRRLTLMSVGLTAAGLRELIAVYAGQLEKLQLYGNPLGDAGADLVAAAAWPRMVPQSGRIDVGLFLGGCGIGDRGAKAVRESRTIPADIPTLFLGQ